MTSTAAKSTSTWYSERTGTELNCVRWGHFGRPVLVFPTAGGDAEEIERMLMIKVLGPLIDDGRIKVYSVDSVAARDWGDLTVPGEHKAALLDGFLQAVRHEVIPAIRQDCHSEDIGVIVAGASIGGFNALACLCRFPDAFTHAVCMSSTHDVDRFMKNAPSGDQRLHLSMPLRFLSDMDGGALEQLRTRSVLMAHGGGRWEDPEQDWGMASLLGTKGVPNRVDNWGEGYDHDWPTWRAMLPKYLDELTASAGDD